MSDAQTLVTHYNNLRGEYAAIVGHELFDECVPKLSLIASQLPESSCTFVEMLENTVLKTCTTLVSILNLYHKQLVDRATIPEINFDTIGKEWNNITYVAVIAIQLGNVVNKIFQQTEGDRKNPYNFAPSIIDLLPMVNILKRAEDKDYTLTPDEQTIVILTFFYTMYFVYKNMVPSCAIGVMINDDMTHTVFNI